MKKEELDQIRDLFSKKERLEKCLKDMSAYSSVTDVEVTRRSRGGSTVRYKLSSDGNSLLTPRQHAKVEKLTLDYVIKLEEYFKEALEDVSEELESLKLHRTQ